MTHSASPTHKRNEGMVTFSVIIPCYNAERYIADTLESALLQRYLPLEVLVIDDGSTDRTAEIVQLCAQQDERVRLLFTPAPSGGPSVPRNIGISAARGDYVALLDADDLWSENKLANDAKFLERVRPDILYSGRYTFHGSRENILHTQPSRCIDWRFEIKNYAQTSSICIRKAYCDTRSDVFDTDPLMKFEDYHFLLRAYFGGARIANRPGIDTYYRFHSDTSRMQWSDLDASLRRQYYNIAKLGMLYDLPLRRYYWMMFGYTLRIWRQAICRRVRRQRRSR